MTEVDPLDWLDDLEPALRAATERAILRFVADCEQVIVELSADGVPPAAILATLDERIDAWAPVLADEFLAPLPTDK